MFDIGEAIETRHGVIDRLRLQHRASAVAHAEEIFSLTELFRQHCRNDAAVGVNPARAGEFATTEAATALRMTEAAVSGLIDIGLALDHELPITRAAFAIGDIDLPHVRVIVNAVINVDPAVIAEIEQRLVDAAMGMNPTRLRHNARRWIAARDPHGEKKRREHRVADRDVRIKHLGDGVADVDGLLPAIGAQTLAMRLREMSMSVCAYDPRTFAQRRADALVALADGSGQLSCSCGRDDCPVSDTPIAAPRKPLIQVGVSLDTLLKLREYPGFLAGCGAVDADLVRELAKDGRWEVLLAAADAAVEITDPETDTQRRTYAPSVALARWIRARDGHCRFPGCIVPAALCDIDHTCPFCPDNPDEGGLTERENTACLCRRHHRLKTDGDNGRNGWRVRQIGRGRLQWTSPSGQKIITTPAGAGYLFPDNIPDPIPPAPEPVHEPDIPAELPSCTSPDVLDRYFGPHSKSWIEEDLRYLLSTHIPPEIKARLPDPPRTDLDEPPPF
ncbi:HNH endonuclease signature motif containing protein [Antrihabitans cavernicola]|uniref:DUF222 domain-containing protein n=1 Tax=Antrihabitans cavernicola TaxID=2495913 RepID=A0A5A7SH07_9NOCA|nr:HNH endonuclease signature motif containing protein [Spelaeibacter cavernicola]KAA0023997.1 DUF222 domain-containing protein [Spelaeibacter cavernicola]